MLNLKPTFKITPSMSKYINDCTNKYIEQKFNKKKSFTDTFNTEVSVNSKSIYFCSFFCIISFLAGYQFKSLQNKL